MTATEEKLIEVLSKGLKLRVTTPIVPETRIFGKEGLGLDSVDVLEITVLIDKHFGIMLEEQNQEVNQALTSIGTLAAFIDRHAPSK